MAYLITHKRAGGSQVLTETIAPARQRPRELKSGCRIDSACNGAGEHIRGDHTELAERKYRIRQWLLSHGCRKNEITIEWRVHRVDRACKSSLCHHCKPFCL